MRSARRTSSTASSPTSAPYLDTRSRRDGAISRPGSPSAGGWRIARPGHPAAPAFPSPRRR
jgi:hypothetical protein